MYGILGKRRLAMAFGLMAGMIAAAGCDSNASSIGIRQQENGKADGGQAAGFDERVLPAWIRSEQTVLRHQFDADRSRLWALTAAGVELYEVATRQKLAHIALPGWVWVDEQYACAPGLAIGPAGEAVVSSNVVPRFWRIDPVTLVASEHEVALNDDTGRDIGFTGLTYSARQGAYFAVSAFQGSLWRIDPRLQRAQSIPLSGPVANACDLAIRSRASDQRASRFVGFCVRAGQENWLVDLAPDQRSGFVSKGSCLAAS